jgi:hypothetical protein
MGQIGIWESFHQSHFGNYFPETPIIKFVHRVFQKEDLRGEQQKEQLKQAFNRFESVELDYLEYSDHGGKHITKYWLVEAQK